MSETFTLLAAVWDVAKARDMVRDREPSASVEVRHLAGFFGLIHIDRAHAATVDLEEPVIMAPVAGSYMMIDGWHRAWRAYQEGVKVLPAHALTQAEERRVRIR